MIVLRAVIDFQIFLDHDDRAREEFQTNAQSMKSFETVR